MLAITLTAITLAQAKNLAIGIVVVFVVAAVGSAWLMKTVTQKALAVMVLGALAFAVWSQRTSLKTCADLVRENVGRQGVSVEFADTDCEFFGVTVSIKDSGAETAASVTGIDGG